MNPALAIGLAAVLALAGRRIGWLTAGGAAAAAAVGGMVFIGAGWRGAGWLALFFVSGSLLGDRPAGPVPHLEPPPRRHGRTWRQVAANGGWAAIAAALIAAGLTAAWTMLAGALGAAIADTWATELGTRSPRAPRLITTGRVVPAGTSGGVTALGTLSGIAGAGVMALLARGSGLPSPGAAGALVGGVSGMLVDSLLGATVQGVYYCERCGTELERPRHAAGHAARLIRGRPWMDNDAVNFVSTGLGAALAVGVAAL